MSRLVPYSDTSGNNSSSDDDDNTPADDESYFYAAVLDGRHENVRFHTTWLSYSMRFRQGLMDDVAEPEMQSILVEIFDHLLARIREDANQPPVNSQTQVDILAEHIPQGKLSIPFIELNDDFGTTIMRILIKFLISNTEFNLNNGIYFRIVITRLPGKGSGPGRGPTSKRLDTVSVYE